MTRAVAGERRLDKPPTQRGLRRAVIVPRPDTPFVVEQRERVRAGDLGALVTPREEVYPVTDAEMARRLGVAPQ
jgi:hypothetical protein